MCSESLFFLIVCSHSVSMQIIPCLLIYDKFCVFTSQVYAIMLCWQFVFFVITHISCEMLFGRSGKSPFS